MLGKLTQLINAGIFGSIAVLAVQLGEPGRATPSPEANRGKSPVVRTISERPTSSVVRTVSETKPGGETVRTVTEVPSTTAATPPANVIRPPTVTGGAAALAPLAATGAAALAGQGASSQGQAGQPAQGQAAQGAPTGPRVFSPSAPLLPQTGSSTGTLAPRSGEAVVPPVVRKKPGQEKDPASKTKGSAPSKPANVAGKANIDLSGRSGLGAGNGALKCGTGMKPDAAQQKCVKAPAKAGTAENAKR